MCDLYRLPPGGAVLRAAGHQASDLRAVRGHEGCLRYPYQVAPHPRLWPGSLRRDAWDPVHYKRQWCSSGGLMLTSALKESGNKCKI